jgi:hypothetical protein
VDFAKAARRGLGRSHECVKTEYSRDQAAAVLDRWGQPAWYTFRRRRHHHCHPSPSSSLSLTQTISTTTVRIIAHSAPPNISISDISRLLMTSSPTRNRLELTQYPLFHRLSQL